MSMTAQYVIVGIILLSVAVWIAVKLRNKKQCKDSGCYGCSLYDTCKDQRQDCIPKDKQKRSSRE